MKQWNNETRTCLVYWTSRTTWYCKKIQRENIFTLKKRSTQAREIPRVAVRARALPSTTWKTLHNCRACRDYNITQYRTELVRCVQPAVVERWSNMPYALSHTQVISRLCNTMRHRHDRLTQPPSILPTESEGEHWRRVLESSRVDERY